MTRGGLDEGRSARLLQNAQAIWERVKRRTEDRELKEGGDVWKGGAKGVERQERFTMCNHSPKSEKGEFYQVLP